MEDEAYLNVRRQIIINNLRASVGIERAELVLEALQKDCRPNEMSYTPLTFLELCAIHSALGKAISEMKFTIATA
mgnify:FL=1